MKEIKAIIQPFRLESVCAALQAIEGLPGLTVSQVAGWGKTQGRDKGDVVEAGQTFAGKTKLETVVPDDMVEQVVETIANAARTGNIGDGKIFIYAVDDVLKIRTGDRGNAAITQFLLYHTLTVNFFTFWGVTDEDAYLIPSVRYSFTDALWAEIGANVFFGKEPHTMFGALERNDNVYLTIRYGF